VTTSIEEINRWINVQREHERLEFKEAKNQYDTARLTRYCVAMANEGGGKFILGVTDRPPRKIVGSQAFSNTAKIQSLILDKLGFRVEVEEVQHPEGRVVIFHIPPRPSGTAYHVDGAYLMRSGEDTVPMSEDHLRAIFDEGKPDWLEENSKTDLDAGHIIELLDTQTFFELLKQPYPTERAGVIDRLLRERLLDVVNGRYTIRRLGALLLARTLDDFPDLARKAPRVVVYTGSSKMETRLDQTSVRGYAVGFQGLTHFVMSQLPQNEMIENALRKAVKALPEVIIRELVANALIHQELTIGGASVMIEIYSNRVEISNPGEPLVPVERLIDGYQSRNERLADLMRRLGICEEKSSGIDRVVHAAEAYQLPAPHFRAGHRRMLVTIYGPRAFEQMDREDRIRACYQHSALRWVMAERMTNQSLRARFHLPESKSAIVSQIIAATLETGLIKADEKVGGSRKFARYLPFWA
jgi:predicted HTH transcriptional regulator